MRWSQVCPLVAAVAALSCEGDVCREAADEMESTIESVCREKAFAASWYCVTCPPTGLFSVDDQCKCRPLLYGDEACLYEPDESGKEAVRAAIDGANTLCTPPPVSTTPEAE